MTQGQQRKNGAVSIPKLSTTIQQERPKKTHRSSIFSEKGNVSFLPTFKGKERRRSWFRFCFFSLALPEINEVGQSNFIEGEIYELQTLSLT